MKLDLVCSTFRIIETEWDMSTTVNMDINFSGFGILFHTTVRHIVGSFVNEFERG